MPPKPFPTPFGRVASLLASRNAKHVAAFDRAQAKPLGLKLRTAIVTCMDSRIDVFDMLGVEAGDVHVIRTAGGRIQDALRSLVISQTQIGLNEVMLIQHTDCAALTFTELSLRAKLLSKTTSGYLPPTAPFQISSTAFLPFPPAPDPSKGMERLPTNASLPPTPPASPSPKANDSPSSSPSTPSSSCCPNHSSSSSSSSHVASLSPSERHMWNVDVARLEESVKWDVDWLRNQAIFDQRTEVSGWVYEVETGRLREVDTQGLEEPERREIEKEKERLREESKRS